MNSMRDAGVVLVLLLVAATVRIDQPAGASVLPGARVAVPVAGPPVRPALRSAEGVTDTRHEVHALHVVRLSGTLAPPGAKDLATVVLEDCGGPTPLVFVSPFVPPPPAPAAPRARLG